MRAYLRLNHIKNMATQLELHSPKSKPLEVIECNDQNLSFITKNVALAGQLVFLSGALVYGQETVDFEATGRIEAVSEASQGMFRFDIHLHQFDRTLWKRFVTALNSRQARADRIFASIRSEE